MQNDDSQMRHDDASARDDVEELLASFSPVATSIARDRMMFLAGMQAAQAEPARKQSFAQSRLWPALALASTAASIALAVMLWQQPVRTVTVERIVERVVPLPVDSHAAGTNTPRAFVSADPVSMVEREQNYLIRRQQFLERGLDTLAQAEIPGGSSTTMTVTHRQLLQEFSGDEAGRRAGQETSNWWQQMLIPGDAL